MATADPRVAVVVADITTLDVDAIVNAANEQLGPGAGVNGAIQRAAGPGLLAECLALGGCPTGEARITAGHLLKARHVIHAVGPIYDDGQQGEAERLASCYRQSLRLAADHGLESIAFPAISTRIFGYPIEEATRIALREVGDWLATHDRPARVVFCCFRDADAAIYRRELASSGLLPG